MPGVAIAVGALGSFVWSFALTAGILRLKHWRNGRLLARGGLPLKDCIFSVPFWVMATLLGLATVAPVAVFVSSSVAAVALAALVPPSALALVPLLAIASQLRDGRK